MNYAPLRIHLGWDDPATGDQREPRLSVPIALGRDFNQMPAQIQGRPVSRMVLNSLEVSRFHFYPTSEQEQLLRRTLGCVRLVYNKALHTRTAAWDERQERIGYIETSGMLTLWKKQDDLQFLKEVSCVPLQPGLRNLQKAFGNFWAGRAKYPNFKKKSSGGSAEFTNLA